MDFALPCEILLHIFGFVPSTTLLSRCRLVCKRWNELIAVEAAAGKYQVQLEIDFLGFRNEEDLFKSLDSYPRKNIAQFRFINGTDKKLLHRILKNAFETFPNLTKISFSNCAIQDDAELRHKHLSQIELDFECKVEAEFYGALGEQTLLRTLKIPTAPIGFVPFLTQNKNYLTELEVGEIPNEVVFLICSELQTSLKSLSFVGSELSYSGVIGLLQCRETLQVS